MNMQIHNAVVTMLHTGTGSLFRKVRHRSGTDGSYGNVFFSNDYRKFQVIKDLIGDYAYGHTHGLPLYIPGICMFWICSRFTHIEQLLLSYRKQISSNLSKQSQYRPSGLIFFCAIKVKIYVHYIFLDSRITAIQPLWSLHLCFSWNFFLFFIQCLTPYGNIFPILFTRGNEPGLHACDNTLTIYYHKQR